MTTPHATQNAHAPLASSNEGGFRVSDSTGDTFTGKGHQLFDALLKNQKPVAVALLVALALGVGFATIQQKREAREKGAVNALYLAKRVFEDELKSLAGVGINSDPAADQKMGDALFSKIDVDAKFPNTVKKFSTVIEQNEGTRAAYDAATTLSSLYFNHGQTEKSLPWAEKAAQWAPNTMEKGFAYWGLGIVQETLGKPVDALRSFERGVGSGPAQGEILLGIARTAETTQNTAKAKAAYDRIKKELPGSEAARIAEQLQSNVKVGVGK